MAISDEVKWRFLKGEDDGNDRLTLLHMLMMVFEGVDPEGAGSGQQAFFKKALSNGITKQTSVSYVTYLMRKEMKGGLTESRYDAIYAHLLGSKGKKDEDDFQSLHEQYEKLKGLGKEKPEHYAKQLWEQMGTPHSAIDASYMDIFRKRSPWLFTERGLKCFNAEQTYKLLTVAIAISLNLKTGVTTRTSDPLDERCKNFLYASPPEELPNFTLREVFETLFSDDSFFAVKRARDDEYVMEIWDNLTDRDQLCILLPWLGIECDLHPDPEEKEAAAALMDNKIAEPEIADRVRKFFVYFSKHKDDVWNKFVAHLKESLTLCTLVDRKKKKPKASIDDILKQKQPSESLPDLSERYLDILNSGSGWSRIDRDKFWNGDQVDISLPEQCGSEKVSEKDVEQLFQYIAAYVLIALCCLKMEGSETREVRKAFKEALIHKIHAPMSVPIEVYEEAIRKNKALEYVVQDVTKENEDRKRYIETSQMTMRALVRQWMIELHTSFDADLREARKRDIKDVLPWCGYTQNEIAEIEEELITNSRVRKNDPPGWNNGGN